MVVGLCLGISLIGRRSARCPAGASAESQHAAPRLVPLPTESGGPSPFIVVQTGIAGHDDLFYYTMVPTTTYRNLTKSPVITEVWPVLDTTSGRVAYYGVSEAGIDLYIQGLPEGTATPLTVHAGESGLHTSFEITTTIGPVFSPSGRWLAFPAQAIKHDAVELFIVQDDGQRLLRVTDLGYHVRDYAWLDDRTLVVATQWSDGTVHYWTARLEQQGIRLELLP